MLIRNLLPSITLLGYESVTQILKNSRAISVDFGDADTQDWLSCALFLCEELCLLWLSIGRFIKLLATGISGGKTEQFA